MGSGLQLERKENDRIESLLDQVITELQMSWPGRAIEKHFALTQTVNFDKKRLSQLFSNLLSNALTHGDPEAPVIVAAATADCKFTLSISNNGKQIPDNIRNDLFQPFYRGDNAQPGKQGLGLGLYISSEIAKAHGGQIVVSSTPEKTVFIFTMPLD
jgi:signal transduction histidine kinase